MHGGMSEIATSGRELIRAAGPPMRPGDNLKRYFSILSERTGLSVRVIRAAWQGQQLSRQTAAALREAQGRHEARELAERLESMALAISNQDESRNRAVAVALLDAVRALRGMDRAGNDGRQR